MVEVVIKVEVYNVDVNVSVDMLVEVVNVVRLCIEIKFVDEVDVVDVLVVTVVAVVVFNEIEFEAEVVIDCVFSENARQK